MNGRLRLPVAFGSARASRPERGPARGPVRRRTRYLSLLVGLLAAMLIAISAGGWILYRAVRDELDRQLGRRLMSIAATAGETFGADRLALLRESSGADQDRLRRELERLASVNDLQNIQLIDSSRIVLFDLRGGAWTGEIDPLLAIQPELGATLLSGEPRASRLVSVRGLPGEYLKTGYAALEDPSGEIHGAIAVEGGSEFFRVLPGMRRRLLWSALGASLGALVLVLLILRVLRSLIRYEDSVQRAAALAAIGQISALVAHEVKNPLAIIRSRSERLRAKLEKGSDPRELLVWFDAIPAEVDRLDAILTNYLALARPDVEGEGSCRPDAVARETAAFLRPELENRGLTVEEEFDPDGRARVAMGARSLKQVFLNLLLNAMQASERGGPITIRTRREHVGFALEVEDRGRGMTEEERRRAQEPFFTTRPTGSGLGLSLVQSLVEARAGRVEIRSAVGRGTRVTIRLPSASSERERETRHDT